MSPSSDPYRSSQKLGAGARQTEARALMETARALADAQENMEDLFLSCRPTIELAALDNIPVRRFSGRKPAAGGY